MSGLFGGGSSSLPPTPPPRPFATPHTYLTDLTTPIAHPDLADTRGGFQIGLASPPGGTFDPGKRIAAGVGTRKTLGAG